VGSNYPVKAIGIRRGDKILVSIGPGFNNYRPNELELKIEAGAQQKTFADYFGSPAAFVP
jgi:hypothetical protein